VATALLAIALAILPGGAKAQSLATFAVLGGQSVTNTGSSVITGNVGVSPGSSITGFPPGIVVPPYSIYQTDGVANQAQNDLTTAYNILAARPMTADLTGVDLAGQTLSPGVYHFDTSASLNGTLTLDAHGDPNAVFIFQIGSTLTTGSGASVVLINGAQAANVYFVVGSSATLGTTTQFQGKILALTSITLNTSASINCGAALARNGSVTLDTNTILVCPLLAATFVSSLDSTATANQRAVGQAIDNFSTGGGVLPLGFAVLSVLTPEALAAAFTQLSGENATAVAPTEAQAMSSFLSLLRDESGGGPSSGPALPGPQASGPGTVRVLDYAPVNAPRGAASAFASLDNTTVGALPPSAAWSVWGAVYGAQNTTAGDAAIGSHQRSTRINGIAIGLDYAVDPTAKLGLAISGGSTSFGLSDGLGSGNSDMVQAAVYGRKDFGRAYVSGALAFARHDMTTDRYVTVDGLDHFAAAFSTHNVGGQIEAGYRIGAITPYAALRVQSISTPAYQETTVSGLPTFALGYAASTTTTFRTELGVEVGRTIPLHPGAALQLTARTAWAHDYWSGVSSAATFQALPGSSFTVQGAPPASDSWLVSAEAEIKLTSGLSIAGRFDGEFAQNSQTYAGLGQIKYSW
jgi:outer membrane autotransporter protein